MDLDKYKKLIAAYLHGNTTSVDNQKIDAWFDSISADEIEPFSSDAHRQSVREEIFSFIKQHTIENRIARLRRLYRMAGVAAALVIGLILTFFITKDFLSGNMESRFVTLATGPGEIRSVWMPDSSQIWLNGNAKIRYDSSAFISNRKIILEGGEAFFNVKRDPGHPFIVESGAIQVEVLGTAFSMFRSSDSEDVDVAVESGRVRVYDQEGSWDNILYPGDGVRYVAHDRTVTRYESNLENISLWTKGGLFLQEVSFEQLRQVLYDRYGVLIETDHPQKASFRFSLLLPQVDSIDQVLKMICNIHQFDYRREQNHVILY